MAFDVTRKETYQEFDYDPAATSHTCYFSKAANSIPTRAQLLQKLGGGNKKHAADYFNEHDRYFSGKGSLLQLRVCAGRGIAVTARGNLQRLTKQILIGRLVNVRHHTRKNTFSQYFTNELLHNRRAPYNLMGPLSFVNSACASCANSSFTTSKSGEVHLGLTGDVEAGEEILAHYRPRNCVWHCPVCTKVIPKAVQDLVPASSKPKAAASGRRRGPGHKRKRRNPGRHTKHRVGFYREE
jgi:hypothetical protein